MSRREAWHGRGGPRVKRRTPARPEGGFRTLAENSPDLIARLDAGLRHLYINRIAESVFGVATGDLIGRTFEEAGVPAAATEACTSAAREALRTAREQRFEFRLPAQPQPGQRVRHFSGRVIPEFGGGRAETVLMIVYDVTQRAEAEAEREALLTREQAAREQAEASARARDQFLAIVSHELRSPLNGISSWTHVLDQQLPDKSPAVTRALSGIRLGVDQQVRLIEDLLDATRIVSGQLRLSRTPVALRPVLEAAVQSVAPAASAKQVTLATQLRLDGEQIHGDPDRLQQIVWNLLDNAVKFVPDGGHVWLDARRDGATVLIEVRDDGRGIEPAFLPHLFDPFRQADTTSTRRHEGLGLGLALVRHLAELHGGRVSVESRGAGSGATFRVRLPVHSIAAHPALPIADDVTAELPSLAGLRVLIVDDQEEARDSVAALLANAGAAVTTAGSGREALAQLQAMPDGQRPDLLLCDIAMPERDGYQTLRDIRAWEDSLGRATAPIPAIALTAFALREDRIRAFAAGYRMHLAKPVSPAELIVVVATVAGKSRALP